jgi:hypothetical protein
MYEGDVFVGVLGLEMQQLGDRQVREFVIDRAAEEDDPLVEEARVDVERTLAVPGLLDHLLPRGSTDVEALLFELR